MRVRKAGSVITYSSSIVSGIIGVALCCFFGLGEVSSPSGSNFGYILLGGLMVLLIVFGYRGIKERRKLSNEIWWQLLTASLIWVLFLALFVIFIFTYVAILNGGQTRVL
jgi:hypothetical protein